MRLNVTATPRICGTLQEDCRQTRQCRDISYRGSAMDTIAAAVMAAIDGMRVKGESLTDPRNAIVLTFDTFG